VAKTRCGLDSRIYSNRPEYFKIAFLHNLPSVRLQGIRKNNIMESKCTPPTRDEDTLKYVKHICVQAHQILTPPPPPKAKVKFHPYLQVGGIFVALI
jgi:hypothetical protein